MVNIKSAHEIELMRESGKVLEEVHFALAEMVLPGVSTWDIDAKARELLKKMNSIPTCLNYCGFPAAICASVNDEVIHGIPSKKTILQEGDLVSLDFCVMKNGYQTDAARTYGVGKISPAAQKLIDVTKQSFFEGLKYAKAGNHLHDISAAVEDYVVANGFSCVRDYCGHGIGKEMHEDPQIPNYHQISRGIRLRPGMTICVEPMVCEGRYDVCVLDDDWTVVTEDGKLSAHYENTILITEGEPELLTLTK